MALRRTTVADVYVPLKRVATVSASAPLTLETLQALRDAGHSRIPLRWSQTPGDWRDFILVKELVGCRPVHKSKFRGAESLPSTRRLMAWRCRFVTARRSP